MADVAALKRRLATMKSRRKIIESHLEEVAEYIAPRNIGFTSKPNMGEKRMSKIFDNTALTSVNLLAAGLHGMATNPSMSWFSLSMADPRFNEEDQVKNWLADVTRIMRAYMYAPGTGITTALNEVYADLAAFGTAAMFIGLQKNGGLLYQSKPLSQVFIAENADGVVDTLALCYQITARNMKAMWPGKLSDKTEKMANDPSKCDEMVNVVYFVQPRSDGEYDPQRKDSRNLPFMACYFEENGDRGEVLEETGYHEFPYAAPRWIKNSGEEYGRSPGMEALPDVKMLQEMMRTTIKAAQKIVDPPINVPDDGHIGPVRTYPGGINYYRGDKEITPLQTGANIPLSLEMMNDLRNRIRNTFYVDMLQFTTDTQMTATEVMQRTQERLRLLGPVVGRIEGELIGTTVVRSFGLLYRSKKLPEAPEMVQGQQFVVQFVSPIAMAQKQTEANGLAQALQFVLPVAERLPDAARSILAPIKVEKLWPWVADRFNVDPDLTKTREEVEAEAEREEQARANQEALMAAQMGADAAGKGAGAVEKLAKANQAGADVGAAQSAIEEMSRRTVN